MGFAHVIPQLTKKILKHKKRNIIINNSKHKRTFCDIDFAIELIFNISHNKGLNRKTFNIGSPENEISIMQLSQKIKKILNSKNQLISSTSQKDNSPERRRPDMSKSLHYTRQKHNFEKKLKEAVLWYKNYYTK